MEEILCNLDVKVAHEIDWGQYQRNDVIVWQKIPLLSRNKMGSVCRLKMKEKTVDPKPNAIKVI